MGYWVKAVLGLSLFLAGLAAFEYSLHELMQVGTCASGGPYVSARPCPEGTAEKALLIPAGLIVGMVGLIVFALRGRRPGAESDSRRVSAALLGWSSLFIVTGVVAALTSYGPGSDPDQDARWVGIFLFALFVPMGLAGLLVARAGRRTRIWASQQIDMSGLQQFATTPGRAGAPPPASPATAARPSPPAPSAPVPTTGDPVDRLRRLGELRDKGVLSPAEFDAAKARILAEL